MQVEVSCKPLITFSLSHLAIALLVMRGIMGAKDNKGAQEISTRGEHMRGEHTGAVRDRSIREECERGAQERSMRGEDKRAAVVDTGILKEGFHYNITCENF